MDSDYAVTHESDEVSKPLRYKQTFQTNRFKSLPTSKEKERAQKNLSKMRSSVITIGENSAWYKNLQLILYNFLERPRGLAAGLYQIIM